jgi:decaprenyl-phosphate phosphoribosyltransferase
VTASPPARRAALAGGRPAPGRPGPGRRLRLAGRWASAVIRTARPRQWPKNLLVLAAPLAAAAQGRDDGVGYALVAVAAFTAASCAVYFVNDVIDASRDRLHPVKCRRPVAAGDLPRAQALALGGIAGVLALAAGLVAAVPWLTVTVAAYLAISFLYSVRLKHVPVLELACVASGFVLRALGGAAATRLPPSGWFLAVCGLGALMVAVAKRRGELARLGPGVTAHRPVTRWYSRRALGIAGRAIAAGVVIAYALWASSTGTAARQAWHLASAVPLAVALARFDWLAGRRAGQPVEDLIAADPVMGATELAWLVLFVLGI